MAKVVSTSNHSQSPLSASTIQKYFEQDLVDAIEGASAEIRLKAIKRLAPIQEGLPEPRALRVLAQALHDVSSQVRFASLGQISRAGAGAKMVADELIELTRYEDNPLVFEELARAITTLGKAGKAAHSWLLEKIEGGDTPLRREALRAMAAIGPSPKETVSVIERCLACMPGTLVAPMVQVLRKCGREAYRLVPRLEQLIRDSDLAGVLSSSQTLIGLGVYSAVAVRKLIEIGTGLYRPRGPQSDQLKGIDVINELGNYRDAAAPAIPLLRSILLLPGASPKVIYAALQALGKLGEVALDALPEIRRAAEEDRRVLGDDAPFSTRVPLAEEALKAMARIASNDVGVYKTLWGTFDRETAIFPRGLTPRAFLDRRCGSSYLYSTWCCAAACLMAAGEPLSELLERIRADLRRAYSCSITERPLMAGGEQLQLEDVLKEVGKVFKEFGPAGTRAALNAKQELPKLDEGDRLQLLEFVTNLGQGAEALVEDLRNYIKSATSSRMKCTYLNFLARLGPAAVSEVPYLIEQVMGPDPAVAAAACNVLGSIGPGAIEARDVLTLTLLTDQKTLSSAAREAMVKIGIEDLPKPGGPHSGDTLRFACFLTSRAGFLVRAQSA